MDGIYDRILEGLTNILDPDDLPLIWKMISWVVLAQTPLQLTVAEFKAAMAIELDSDSMDFIVVMLYISREIRNLCGSLEIVSEQTPIIIVSNLNHHDNPEEDDDCQGLAATVRLKLIHQSAKDYFFDHAYRLSSPLPKFRIFGHNEMALMCLTYLFSKDFGTGSLKSDSSTSGTPLPIDDDTVLRNFTGTSRPGQRRRHRAGEYHQPSHDESRLSIVRKT